MNGPLTGSLEVNGSAIEEMSALDARLQELHSLSGEIVDLFYTQTLSPDTIRTPAEVCAAFSAIILRHWDLCCIVIFLRDEDGRLRASAVHTHEHFDEATARRVSAQLVAAGEQKGSELQVWVSEEDGTEAAVGELRRSLEEAGLRAGVVVPIHAQKVLVGALVAVTIFPERLRAALNGLRFLAAPVVIGIGNAQRAGALREQHQHIEHLVEELQKRTSDLEEANRELLRVAQYRSLFLARMSHELRTPLTSMLGFAEILVDYEDLTEPQRRFCEKIQASGRQLQTRLNQLVDLSRIEAGQTELFLRDISVHEILRESCAAVARIAEKRGVTVNCAPPPQLSSIVSDEGKLRQVLYNFFAHAINRTPEGASVAISAESFQPARLQIVIEDEGEIIPDASRIFEPIDVGESGVKTAGLNELGLVIARRLVGVLGGDVQVENPSDGGLRVTIELPTCPAEEMQK